MPVGPGDGEGEVVGGGLIPGINEWGVYVFGILYENHVSMWMSGRQVVLHVPMPSCMKDLQAERTKRKKKESNT